MEGSRTAEGVQVGGDARQRFHQARGYGRATPDGTVVLAPVEAAHLLYREDLDSVEGLDFAGYCRRVSDPGFLTRFAVYKDVRERGFYLDPLPDGPHDFDVYERGADPTGGPVAYEVRVVDESRSIRASSLRAETLAIVDEEGEVAYIAVTPDRPEGDVPEPEPLGVPADLVGDRVVVWDPPAELYGRYFFGQPIGGRNATDEPLQLSFVEAAYLVRTEVLELGIDLEELERRARAIGGEGFDRRRTVYTELRERGTVPKTGYKFGADFRVYPKFASIDGLEHSDSLVRVLAPAESLRPRAIALDVRLAGGVGKRMLFALSDATQDRPTTWFAVERLTP